MEKQWCIILTCNVACLVLFGRWRSLSNGKLQRWKWRKANCRNENREIKCTLECLRVWQWTMCMRNMFPPCAQYAHRTHRVSMTKWKIKCNWNILICAFHSPIYQSTMKYPIEKCFNSNAIAALHSSIELLIATCRLQRCIQFLCEIGTRERGSFHWDCWFCCFRWLLLFLVVLFAVSVCLCGVCLRLCVYKYIHVYVAVLYKFRHYSLERLHISQSRRVLLPSLFVLCFCSCSLVLAGFIEGKKSEINFISSWF